ncbi:MAG: hypothetical protein WCV00_12025 [Verrucomicrobiia bacterium]|jgi:hypothetical protein
MKPKTVKVLCQGDSELFVLVFRKWIERRRFKYLSVDEEKGEAICEVPVGRASELHQKLMGRQAPQGLISAVFPKGSLSKRQLAAGNSVVLGPAVEHQKKVIRELPNLSSTPAKALKLLKTWRVFESKREVA